MKKFLALCTAASLLYGCDAPNYTVAGKLPAASGDSLYLTALYPRDSVLAAGVVGPDSSFVLKGRVSGAEMAVLKVMGEQGFSIPELFLEPGEVTVAVSDDGTVVSGTPLNDSLNLLNRKLRVLRERSRGMSSDDSDGEKDALWAQISGLPADMAEANRDNLLGVYLFGRYVFPVALENPDSARIAAMKVRLDEFPASLQRNPMMRQLRNELAAVEKIQIGKPYIDVSGEDVAGNTVALSSLVGRGRWVLLDFWAAWCRPCVGEIPVLREFYSASKGRNVEIYAVSLDNDPERWRAFVADNELPWINVLGVGADKRSIPAALYAIRSIPANFLISPEGIIVAKNLRGEALEAELAKYIR